MFPKIGSLPVSNILEGFEFMFNDIPQNFIIYPKVCMNEHIP